MKINLIYHDFSYNVMVDVEILTFIFKKFKEKPEPVYVNVNNYKCEEAEINIFLDKVNYGYFHKAKYNIFMPNQHYFNKNNIEFLNCFDMIFCKSKYILETLKPHVNSDKLNYVGWRSPDISSPTISKNFDDYLVLYQDLTYCPIKKIIDNWKTSYPNLHVVIQVNDKNFIRKEQDNISYYDNSNLDLTQYHNLFNRCGIHLCLQESESYSHMMNQCKLAKSLPVSLNGGCFKELVNNECGFFVSGKKKKLKYSLGSRYVFNEEAFEETIKQIKEISETSLKIMGTNGRTQSLKAHNECDGLIKETIQTIFKEIKVTKLRTIFKKDKDKKLTDQYNITDDKFPTVSIITPTFNRKNFFPLAILNYNSIVYPRNKLEWIIVDDSDDIECVESLLPPLEKREQLNIHYYRLPTKKFDAELKPDPSNMTIGEKRNYAIEKSNNEIIVFMDDDDYYPKNSVKERVTALLNFDKQCVCSTVIGCFHISRYISIISTPPIDDVYSEKISEATLCFYKSFWETAEFDHTDSCESKSFIEGRINQIIELPFTNIINSLLHRDNTSQRKIPPKETSNGCHFGWSEKLFQFITGLNK